MPFPKAEKIWMNGELVDWDEARVHVLTPTLHYGYGVFEGIRAYATDRGPAVFQLDAHVAADAEAPRRSTRRSTTSPTATTTSSPPSSRPSA